ncbi:MAG TPA: putative metal-dependent hydrolase [Longimicrobiales bacterium]|nr:putative metal-dependent hydrolase [Longimicrobiales bacterium]
MGRPLEPDERLAHIGAIQGHPARMRVALSGLSDEQLDTPYRAGGWTLRQVVHHVADSHVNAYVRFKLAVTEDRPTVKTYEEHLWAELPDGRSGPIEVSLAILDALHARWVTFLGSLTPEQFARELHYPGLGAITVDSLLELYAWHGRHHEAHVTGLRERMGW